MNDEKRLFKKGGIQWVTPRMFGNFGRKNTIIFRPCVPRFMQSSFYSKDSVSLFTCYIWHQNGDYSRIYVFDDLSHDKYYVGAAVDHLFGDLKSNFQHLK